MKTASANAEGRRRKKKDEKRQTGRIDRRGFTTRSNRQFHYLFRTPLTSPKQRNMVGFKAQLGNAHHPGLLDSKQRLALIERGRNPYVTGEALAPDSLVFLGREWELAETLAVLPGPRSRVAPRFPGSLHVGLAKLNPPCSFPADSDRATPQAPAPGADGRNRSAGLLGAALPYFRSL
jgi:hypothetical protein